MPGQDSQMLHTFRLKIPEAQSTHLSEFVLTGEETRSAQYPIHLVMDRLPVLSRSHPGWRWLDRRNLPGDLQRYAESIPKETGLTVRHFTSILVRAKRQALLNMLVCRFKSISRHTLLIRLMHSTSVAQGCLVGTHACTTEHT